MDAATISIQLLADRPELIPEVGRMRWKEWGHEPEPVDLGWWMDVTWKESGRDALPVTLVAVTPDGAAVGAVGLGKFDIEERRDRSPWILGMIVQRDWRRRGAGRLLLHHLEAWAASRRIDRVWVATGPPAVDFYGACGYAILESLDRRLEGLTFVLEKELPLATAGQASGLQESERPEKLTVTSSRDVARG